MIQISLEKMIELRKVDPLKLELIASEAKC